ncbi:hypothetical protein [Leptothermofonsia sp. ETS-13]|uniref:hypothetical protein n=1 Tax=Leptothermofonsia sp. ETS-13 TaxID=3035696 RepID=UPI003BA19083
MTRRDDRILLQITSEQTGQRSLRPNPFTTYRDPKTGRWIVIVPAPQEKAIVKLSSNCDISKS